MIFDNSTQYTMRPIFDRFDTFMYQARLDYKKNKNVSMA